MNTINISKENIVKTIVFTIFCLTLGLIAIFHEPWFDEAQVWMISRDASLYEMLFVMPHYEGHPALWSLLLAIPAKSGVPFEIGLKTIGFVIAGFSAYLIIFRSPFPKYISYALLFSFFFFYQGGVIVRPYSLMILVLLLLSINLRERDNKPFLLSFLLFVLCCTSAYGIVIACGISLCIVGEIIKEKGFRIFAEEIFIDKRSLSLFLLLIGAILLVLQIVPYENTFVASTYKKNTFFVRFLCTLFTMIGDCFMTRSLWFYYDRTLLQSAEIPWYSLLSCIAIGLIIWICIYSVSGKKSFCYFLVPYLLLAVFSAAVYFNGHHLICTFALFLFWLWIAFDDENRFEGWKRISQSKLINNKDKKLLERFLYCFTVLCLMISLYWTVSSSIMDIRKEYSYGRGTSAFIKEHNLENTNIIGAWQVAELSTGKVDYTNMVATVVPINAYFDRNLAFNLNNGDPDKGFMYYRIPSAEEITKSYETIRRNGLPELMLGSPDLDQIFGEGTNKDNYTIVYYMPINYIWKGDAYSTYMPMMLRNDLLDKYDLSEAPLPDDVSIHNFELTEEQVQLYNEGKITIEDIIGSNNK